MNRRDRRAAAAQERIKQDEMPYNPNSSVRAIAPVVAAPSSGGILLRMFARIMLSRWVIKRVKHPHVLTIMADLAGQAGRMDALMQIQEKLRRHAG